MNERVLLNTFHHKAYSKQQKNVDTLSNVISLLSIVSKPNTTMQLDMAYKIFSVKMILYNIMISHKTNAN